jgi:hypothetical protein
MPYSHGSNWALDILNFSRRLHNPFAAKSHSATLVVTTGATGDLGAEQLAVHKTARAVLPDVKGL